jgi:hypothetical protein
VHSRRTEHGFQADPAIVEEGWPGRETILSESKILFQTFSGVIVDQFR